MLDLLIVLAVLALIVHLWKYIAGAIGCLLLIVMAALLVLWLIGFFNY